MRKEKSPEEKAAAQERMNQNIQQLQARQGPYYECWRERYYAWRKSRERTE